MSPLSLLSGSAPLLGLLFHQYFRLRMVFRSNLSILYCTRRARIPKLLEYSLFQPRWAGWEVEMENFILGWEGLAQAFQWAEVFEPGLDVGRD